MPRDSDVAGAMKKILALVLLTVSSTCFALSNPCDTFHVSINGAAFVVEPTGMDDTLNIQCALDSAIAQGITSVRLAEGEFSITQLEAVEFSGALIGVSKAATRVDITDSSVDCASMESLGQTAAAIKFVGGSPEVRNMSLFGGDFCSSDASVTPSFVHFTGREADSTSCDNDVVFGVVDRVNLFSEAGRPVGVRASPEGYSLGGCKQTLLGTVKINRSELSGFQIAVVTSMRGGAQVDVNYSNFSDNVLDTFFVDSFQSTNVVGNTFNGNPTPEEPAHYSVAIATTIDSPPAQSGFVVSENVFNLASAPNRNSIGVYLEQSEQTVDLAALLVKNTFNLSGEGAFGVYEAGVSNGFVGNNRFTGNGSAAIALGLSATNSSSGWVISANRGLGNFTGTLDDILLDSNSNTAVVGELQQAQVRDLGTSNTVLPVEGGVVPVPVSDTIISSISGSFDGWDGGETIVSLVNGQVWQQADFTFDFSFLFGPRVVIFSDPSCLSGKRMVFPDEFMPPQSACVRRLA